MTPNLDTHVLVRPEDIRELRTLTAALLARKARDDHAAEWLESSSEEPFSACWCARVLDYDLKTLRAIARSSIIATE